MNLQYLCSLIAMLFSLASCGGMQTTEVIPTSEDACPQEPPEYQSFQGKYVCKDGLPQIKLEQLLPATPICTKDRGCTEVTCFVGVNAADYHGKWFCREPAGKDVWVASDLCISTSSGTLSEDCDRVKTTGSWVHMVDRNFPEEIFFYRYNTTP